MAKNSVDSTINVVTETQVRYEGQLVSIGDKLIVFSCKKRGGQKFIQRNFTRDRVLVVSNDYIVVKATAAIPRQLFRPIQGQVEQDKNSGFYVVDGVYINPDFATVEAELGVPGGAAKKPAAPNKKVKKG